MYVFIEDNQALILKIIIIVLVIIIAGLVFYISTDLKTNDTVKNDSDEINITLNNSEK